MTFQSIRRSLNALSVALAAVVVGCGEAPTEHEDVVEVHELIVSDAGTPVVIVDHDVVTGSITVSAGDETPDYDFIFIDHDGDTITAGVEADAAVGNPGLAIFHSTGDLHGHFEGVSAGSTTVVISLIHAADGDSHYDSPAIGLDVN